MLRHQLVIVQERDSLQADAEAPQIPLSNIVELSDLPAFHNVSIPYFVANIPSSEKKRKQIEISVIFFPLK